MNIVDKDDSIEKWVCPHCGSNNGSIIIQDAVLKDDFKEVLCGCLECNEMFIRIYKYTETIKLIREKSMLKLLN